MAFTKKNYVDLTGLSTFKSSLLGTVINDTNKTTTSKTATIKAIADYVDSEVGDLSTAVTAELAKKVSSVTYDSTNKKLVYNKGGSTNTDIVTVATLKSAIGNFVKSGSGASAGLVPAPSTTAGTSKYLREDGTWVTPTNTIPQGYCSTGASTASKVASCSGYILTAKTYLMVVLTTANNAQGALTLNVNGKGAKPIYIDGKVSSSTNYTLPAGSYLTYYDGTNYYFRTDGKITGDITGSASKLNSTINITVEDSDATNSASKVAFDGSKDINLKLPSTIKVSTLMVGNSSSYITRNSSTGAIEIIV